MLNILPNYAEHLKELVLLHATTFYISQPL